MAAVLSDSDHSDSPWREFKGRRTLPSGPGRPKGHEENFDRNTRPPQHSNRKIGHDNWNSRMEESNYSVLKEPRRYNRVRFSEAKNPSRQVCSRRRCIIQKIIQPPLPPVLRTGGSPICLKRNPWKHLWPTYGWSIPLLQSAKAGILLANNEEKLSQFCSEMW